MGDQARRPARPGRRAPHAHIAVLLALLIVGVAACSWSKAPDAARRADRSARVLATETVSRRVRDLVIDSPALDRYAMVRLLLPRRFEAEPGRRYTGRCRCCWTPCTARRKGKRAPTGHDDPCPPRLAGDAGVADAATGRPMPLKAGCGWRGSAGSGRP